MTSNRNTPGSVSVIGAFGSGLLVWAIAIGMLGFALMHRGWLGRFNKLHGGPQDIRLALTIGLSVCLVLRLEFARFFIGIGAGLGGIIGFYTLFTQKFDASKFGNYPEFTACMSFFYLVSGWILMFTSFADHYLTKEK